MSSGSSSRSSRSVPFATTRCGTSPRCPSSGGPRGAARTRGRGGYLRLLKAANRAIKSEWSDARTVTAGLVGPSWDEFRRLYRLGAKRHFDIAALHVYPQTGVRVQEAVRRVRREINRAGDRKARIFLTEVSFPASKGKAKAIRNQRQETPSTMARNLGRLYARLLKDRRRRRTGLDRVYWYTWASDYFRRSSNFNFAGLLASRDGRLFKAQPALDAYRRSAKRLPGLRAHGPRTLQALARQQRLEPPVDRLGAHARHVNSRARARPDSIRRSRSAPGAATVRIASAKPSWSSGSTSSAAGPQVSGSAPRSELTTGVPAAIASRHGRPKPSYRDGMASVAAPA